MDSNVKHEIPQHAHDVRMAATTHEAENATPCVNHQAGLDVQYVEVVKGSAPPYGQESSPPVLFACICGESFQHGHRTLTSEASMESLETDRADLSSRTKASDSTESVPVRSEPNASTQTFRGWDRNSVCESARAALPNTQDVWFAGFDHSPQLYRTAHMSISGSEAGSFDGQRSSTCKECPIHLGPGSQEKHLPIHGVQRAQALADVEARQSASTNVNIIDLQHQQIIDKRGSKSKTRKAIKWTAVFVALAAIIAMVVLLGFTKDKPMTRAAFMGCVLIVDAAVVAWMTADDSTRVEVLIAANLVFVAGIFVIPNVDAFFGYT